MIELPSRTTSEEDNFVALAPNFLSPKKAAQLLNNIKRFLTPDVQKVTQLKLYTLDESEYHFELGTQLVFLNNFLFEHPNANWQKLQFPCIHEKDGSLKNWHFRYGHGCLESQKVLSAP